MSDEAALPVPTPPAAAPAPKPAAAPPILLPPVLVGMAVLGDFLMRESPWGLNVALWGAALYWVAVPLALKWSSGPVPRAAMACFAAAGLFLLTPALRDAPSLHILAYTSSMLCAIYGIAIAHGFPWMATGLIAFIERAFNTLGLLAESGFKTRVGVDLRPSEDAKLNLMVFLRGALLALPFLAVFGFLFARADIRFMQFFNLSIDPAQVLQHVLALSTTGVIAWFVVAAVATRSNPAGPGIPIFATPTARFGTAEVCLALGLITAMFVVFVAIQVQYLFGGVDYMLKTANLTAAEYAKSGFNELVTAGTIALATIYFFDWLTREGAPGGRAALRWIIRVLLVLVAVVLASAAHRMMVYIQMFGLTEQRLMTFAFMGALALLLLWSECTILRDRRDRFTGGAFVVLLAATAAFIAINPHAIIAETNAQRAREGKPFDVRYALTLSNDALPALAALYREPAESTRKGEIEIVFEARRRAMEAQGWRSWNYGKQRAWQALAQN